VNEPSSNGGGGSRRPGGGRRRGVTSNASQKPIRRAMSAGGVVYREQDGHIEIILVARPAHNLWALPKGTPEAGESVEATALREVREETGLEVEIVGEIGTIHYRYTIASEGVLVQKVVHHFLMEPVGGDMALHDHEYDVVAWVDIHEAPGRMSYANERSMVEQASALIADLQAGVIEEAGA